MKNMNKIMSFIYFQYFHFFELMAIGLIF